MLSNPPIVANSSHKTEANTRQHQNPICKGRVSNLESNVEPSWWTQIFDSIYLKTDGDVVEDCEVTASEIDMLESYPYLCRIFRKGMKSTTRVCRIMDLCCGQGRHVLELARRYPCLELYGHDQSEYLIELARSRAQEAGVAHRCVFSVGDCRTIPYPENFFDLILIMGNSFGYFTSTASDLQVLRQCHHVAKQGAYIILDLADGQYMKQYYVPRTWEWIDDGSFVCRERQLSKDRKSLVSREVITDVLSGVVRDQFYSERLYDQDELDLLLEMALLTPARHLHSPQVLPSPLINHHYIPNQSQSSNTLVNPNASPVIKSPPPNAQHLHHLHHLYQMDPLSFNHQFKLVSESNTAVTAAKNLSKRQEDLGMMGHRMLVIACKDIHARHYAPPSSTVLNFGPTIDPYPAFLRTAGNQGPSSHVTSAESAMSSPFILPDQKLTTPAQCQKSLSLDSGVSSTDSHDHSDQLVADELEVVQLPKVYWDAPKSPVPAPKIEHLVVILGDPKVPCPGKLNNAWNKEDLDTQSKLLDVLMTEWSVSEPSLSVLNDHTRLLAQMIDLSGLNQGLLVFNLCDEGYKNDAHKELHVPSLLEMLGIPYTGATPQSLGVCFDKAMVNAQARVMGIPTPREAYYLGSLSTQEHVSDLTPQALDSLIRRNDGLSYPAFVKPMRGDNSLGITSRSLVYNATDLHAYISELDSLGLRDVVVQEYCEGLEFSVGMIGNACNGYMFLPIVQVDYSQIIAQNLTPILGYDSKWDPKSPYWTDVQYVQAHLPCSIVRVVHARCAALFERFECRDYARFDFRVSGMNVVPESIKLLEVNPNPGWCWDGKLAKMAWLAGYTYRDLVLLILHACVNRMKPRT